MKLLRYGPAGSERPGVHAQDGTIRDLSGIVSDIDGAAFEAGLMGKLHGIDFSTLPVVEQNTRLGPCVGSVGNFIAIGLNYTDHAIETNAPIPEEPILFNKARSCIVGPNDDVVLPRGSTHSDWEVELAFLIGKRTYEVSEAHALDHVAGYFICNDISERRFQLEMGGQWVKGKCAPTFGPIGPYLVTADEVQNPQNLDLWLDLNGERLQNSTTRNMIFPIAHLVAYVSRFMVLEAGDIITTGTPPGVGLGMKPERYLKPGDVMELGIGGLGTQRQTVVASA